MPWANAVTKQVLTEEGLSQAATFLFFFAKLSHIPVYVFTALFTLFRFKDLNLFIKLCDLGK